ncbi:myosin light chain kinase family member 4 isoform X3 [Phacochoerus africanus]|uniref:myosin light chain kinase family member 4 isoform X3 n=1 Tax=Phacochoerus africanus TaxID=41426 RepID=UPI001FDA518B|nr:myosin light chain kinase family member 4 isoform X3 [Phacochoerus africanus]
MTGARGRREPRCGRNVIGLATQMLQAKRLGQGPTCCPGGRPEERACFPEDGCMEEMERGKCFLEETSSEQDSRSGKNQAKENAWSHPGLETAPAEDKRTAPPSERPSQKSQPSPETETGNECDKPPAEKTPASAAQRGSAAPPPEGPHDGVQDLAPGTPAESRRRADGRDVSLPEGPSAREGEAQGRADRTLRPAREGRHEERRSEEEPGGGEARAKGRSETPGEPEPDQRSGDEQCTDQTEGEHVGDRCISSIKAVATSRTPGNSAIGPALPHAEPAEPSGGSKRRGAAESSVQEENKKSRIDAACAGEGHARRRTPETRQAAGSSQGQAQAAAGSKSPGQQDPPDDGLVPAAPFDHRIVTAKQAAVTSFYTVSRTEILGGGRFGQVHKCEEKATGLKLAAKIIKTRGAKDKDEAKNEISVMNQLDHVNLIQLYDAFESKHDVVLVLEYVDGGEPFDRIIDDNCSLTELDTILFIRQICEGIRHMHQMYVLHLDLKPENILCVNRDTKQIKIIDFGLARRYKPREKLKVNFGTPEFLAPEVVNYDFVSFPTDMWSVGVIAYMLLSGLSPFLGDTDTETLNNILACRWDLEDAEFQDVSEEAREFISKLLIKEKRRGRIAALTPRTSRPNSLWKVPIGKENCCGCCCFERIFGKISSSDALTP